MDYRACRLATNTGTIPSIPTHPCQVTAAHLKSTSSTVCDGMDIGTCDIVQWAAAPHDCIANRAGFGGYVVLVLNVIRHPCHYFLDIILFHHEMHNSLDVTVPGHSLEYWIEHVSFGLLYVMFTFPTRILYSSRLCNWLSLRRLVSWINHLPLYVGPLFGNPV